MEVHFRQLNQQIDADRVWTHAKHLVYMQNGERPHRTSEVFDFLDEHFHDRIFFEIRTRRQERESMGLPTPQILTDANRCVNNPKTVKRLQDAIHGGTE